MSVLSRPYFHNEEKAFEYLECRAVGGRLRLSALRRR